MADFERKKLTEIQNSWQKLKKLSEIKIWWKLQQTHPFQAYYGLDRNVIHSGDEFNQNLTGIQKSMFDRNSNLSLTEIQSQFSCHKKWSSLSQVHEYDTICW